ncbi:MAG: hypothetical protein M1319_04875 [Chloroflexi bacterium]|nr:hypothetical protein [Chloroflexota bacterium]
MRKLLLVTMLFSLALSAAPAHIASANSRDFESVQTVDLTSGADFTGSELTNVTIDPIADGAITLGADPSYQSAAYAPYDYFGTFVSRPQALDQPVNYVELRYLTLEPAGTKIQVAVRGSVDGKSWGSWIDAPSESGITLTRPAAFLQYRVTLTAQDLNVRPTLLSLSSTTAIDTHSPVPATMQDDAKPALVLRLYATREGLVGARTSNGHTIQPNDRFVALPSNGALCRNGGDDYQVLISYKGRRAIAPVWDVGPWNTHDNYWDMERQVFQDLPLGLPEAQTAFFDGYNDGKDERGRTVMSPAAIDIADGTFIQDLGMVQSDWVDVTFLWTGNLPEKLEVAEPTASPVDPVPAIENNPDVAYFPQTGHNVGYEFLKYWQEHGGVQVFGLPLTDGVKVGSYSAQYFERARFEYHPELPEGQRVVLGKLGTILTANQDFQPASPVSDTESMRYFPETQHTLSNGFLRYWTQNNGEEIFGLPISEEMDFVNQSTGEHLVVQYFERARLEYHPGLKGTPFEVQLGLLGRELLQRKGWLK